jgi:hypothetical protein
MEKEIAVENAMTNILDGKINNSNKGKLPITPFALNAIPKNRQIVISEEALNELKSIREYTLTTNKEIAFYIFGEEQENAILWLDTVITDYDIKHNGSANFESIKIFLKQFISEYKKGEYNDAKQVVCCGHTHSRSSETYDNLSLDDLAAYITFVNSDEVFKNNGMATIGCLLNPSGDYNFYAYNYDVDKNQIHIFNEVYAAYNNGMKEQLPAYQKGQYQIDESYKNHLI